MKKFNEHLLYEATEMNINGYKTKYFFMCPGAQSVFAMLLDDKKVDQSEVRDIAQRVDDFLRIEKKVMDAGEITDEQKEEAEAIYQEIKDQAEGMGKPEAFKFMDAHYDHTVVNPKKAGSLREKE